MFFFVSIDRSEVSILPKRIRLLLKFSFRVEFLDLHGSRANVVLAEKF
jgi:hypothetical protein